MLYDKKPEEIIDLTKIVAFAKKKYRESGRSYFFSDRNTKFVGKSGAALSLVLYDEVQHQYHHFQNNN